MIKVRASMELKEKQELPTGIEIDIPKEYCNRESWNEYIKEILVSMCKDRIRINFEVVD